MALVGFIPVNISADLDGDGIPEIFRAEPDGITSVLKDGVVIWNTAGWIDGWNRSESDSFVTIGLDLDGDGRDEIVVFNNTDLWTGVFRWDGTAMRCPWASPSPISGPNGSWHRRSGDDFGAAGGSGQATVAVLHNADRWYGLLGWNGGGLIPVMMWNQAIQVRKFTYLYDVLEITGTVYGWVTAGTAAPGLDVTVDPGFGAIVGAVPGSFGRIHCETYSRCISDTSNCGGENQINNVVPFEPWAGVPYSFENGGAPLMVTDNGVLRPLAQNDRVRMRGRLLIENGHPQPDQGSGAAPAPGIPGNVGRVFVELHPFDWKNIQLDPIPTGLTDSRTHDLVMIAPLYEAVEYGNVPNPQFADQVDKIVFAQTYHNSVAVSAVFGPPTYSVEYRSVAPWASRKTFWKIVPERRSTNCELSLFWPMQSGSMHTSTHRLRRRSVLYLLRPSISLSARSNQLSCWCDTKSIGS